MRHVLLFLVFTSFASIVYGYTLLDQNPSLGHKFIGGGTAGIFLLAMPLFLFTYSRNKKMKDYMLNKENIRKMQEREEKKNGAS